jgi:hypothetical protein
MAGFVNPDDALLFGEALSSANNGCVIFVYDFASGPDELLAVFLHGKRQPSPDGVGS